MPKRYRCIECGVFFEHDAMYAHRMFVCKTPLADATVVRIPRQMPHSMNSQAYPFTRSGSDGTEEWYAAECA